LPRVLATGAHFGANASRISSIAVVLSGSRRTNDDLAHTHTLACNAFRVHYQTIETADIRYTSRAVEIGGFPVFDHTASSRTEQCSATCGGVITMNTDGVTACCTGASQSSIVHNCASHCALGRQSNGLQGSSKPRQTQLHSKFDVKANTDQG
jgi:hypothetical protein